MDIKLKVEIVNSLCSNLQIDDKRTRKKNLEHLHSEIFGSNLNPEELRKMFDQTYMHILKCVCDSAESCRELAIQLVKDFVINLDKNDYYLTYIFPVLEKRLGAIVLIEESEEIRLLLVILLRTIVDKYQDNLLLPFYDIITKVLVRTVLDPFPKVKKESCEIISELTKALPRNFHTQAETLIKPVITLLGHQHFRIRIVAVQCISDIVEHGGGKINEDAIVGLAVAMNDALPGVRLAVVRAAHAWLLRQPDRYSYFSKIIPLMLLGLTDDVADIAKETQEKWVEAGLQYEQENEKELKDKMDFLSDEPTHYPTWVKKRPILGCRILVIRNTMKLLSAITGELSDWRLEIRQMSSRLLIGVVLHNEGDITQHLQTLLPAMARASKDQDKDVASNVIKAARLVGYFIKPKVYCDIILPTLDGYTGPTVGQLRTLAALMSTSQDIELQDQVQIICSTIQKRDVAHSRENGVEILNCCEAIIDVCKSNCDIVDCELFGLIITVLALTKPPTCTRAEQLLVRLSEVLGLATVEDLYAKHAADLLKTLLPSAKGWTVFTTERCIFETLLLKSKAVFSYNLNMVLKILTETLGEDTDAEAKLKTFLALSSVLVELSEQIDGLGKDFCDGIKTIVMEIILPNLVWHAGRLSEAIRSAAIACICAALPFCASLVSFAEVMPQLVSNLEERDPLTRTHILRAINYLAASNEGKLNAKDVNDVYLHLLKRLDDGVDEVRTEAALSLNSLFLGLPADTYDPNGTHVSHIDYIFSTLLIHLDDHDTKFHRHILDTLKTVSSLNKKLLETKIHDAYEKFRNKDICEEILSYLSA